MDWKSLTSKLDPFIAKMDPYMKKLDPLVDKAKEMGVKTLDFTQRQMQSTPLVLKTQAELDALRSAKRLIVITYDQADVSSREVLLRAPVWATKAWSDAAELRFVEKSASPDIVSLLGVTTPVDMRVWYTGEETFRGSEVPAILGWWKTRCYDGKTETVDSPSQAREDTKKSEKIENLETEKPKLVDPLAGK